MNCMRMPVTRPARQQLLLNLVRMLVTNARRICSLTLMAEGTLCDVVGRRFRRHAHDCGIYACDHLHHQALTVDLIARAR